MVEEVDGDGGGGGDNVWKVWVPKWKHGVPSI